MEVLDAPDTQDLQIVLTLEDFITGDLAEELKDYLEAFFAENPEELYISNKILAKFWQETSRNEILPDFGDSELKIIEKKLFPKGIIATVKEIRDGVKYLLEVLGF